MKAETVVDLFQFIKAARLQRAGLVTNKVSSNVANMKALCNSSSPYFRTSMSLVIKCWLTFWMVLTLMPTSKRLFELRNNWICS